MSKVGLALGGGGAKGFAHIGVLKVLEKNEIKIDAISGTSIGSVIGGLYAAGHTAKEIETFAVETDWASLLDITFPRTGILKGDKIEDHLRRVLGRRKIEDLKIPFVLTAADVNYGDKIVFVGGDLVTAIRSSISIPGIFEPVRHGKMLLVDGGIGNPLPVDILKKEFKIKKTIAVDLSTKVSQKKIRATGFQKKMADTILDQEVIEIYNYLKKQNTRLPKLLAALFKSKALRRILRATKIKLPETISISNRALDILTYELSRYLAKEADVLIHPDFKRLNSLNYDKVKEFIRIGEKYTKKALPEIKKLR